MLPHMSRELVQITSTFIIGLGICVMASGPNNNITMLTGCALIGISVWFLLMAESTLLAKVQSEMTTALAASSAKSEREIEELLYFLRESKVNSGPFETWEGTKNYVTNMQCPAFLMGPALSILKANKQFTDLLGWKPGTLDGVSSHTINDPLIMSKVGMICSSPEYADVQEMALRYLYIHKTGLRIQGTLKLTKIVDNAFLMVFLPDDSLLVGQPELDQILYHGCEHP